jgi:hypothetical protein
MAKKECFGQFVTTMEKYGECRDCGEYEDCLDFDHDKDLINLKTISRWVGIIICAIGLYIGFAILYKWFLEPSQWLRFWAGLFTLIALECWGASVIVSALKEKRELQARVET